MNSWWDSRFCVGLKSILRFFHGLLDISLELFSVLSGWELSYLRAPPWDHGIKSWIHRLVGLEIQFVVLLFNFSHSFGLEISLLFFLELFFKEIFQLSLFSELFLLFELEPLVIVCEVLQSLFDFLFFLHFFDLFLVVVLANIQNVVIFGI